MPLKLKFSATFSKKLNKLARKKPQTIRRYFVKLKIFRENPREPSLKTHKLSGNMKDKYAFFVESDCRVIFSWNGDEVEFVLIGKHDEVY